MKIHKIRYLPTHTFTQTPASHYLIVYCKTEYGKTPLHLQEEVLIPRGKKAAWKCWSLIVTIWPDHIDLWAPERMS